MKIIKPGLQPATHISFTCNNCYCEVECEIGVDAKIDRAQVWICQSKCPNCNGVLSKQLRGPSYYGPGPISPVEALQELIRNDGYAMSFQTLGQYRVALLRSIDAAALKGKDNA